MYNVDNGIREELSVSEYEMWEDSVRARLEYKTHRMAFKMIRKGNPNEEIAEITELDIDLIELIRRNNPN
jgi:hypothetical protein